MDVKMALRRIVGNHGIDKPISAAEICRVMATAGMQIVPRTIADIASETRIHPNGQPPMLALKGAGGYYTPRCASDYRPWFREYSATIETSKRPLRAVRRYYDAILKGEHISAQVDLFPGVCDSPPTPPDSGGAPADAAGAGNDGVNP